MSRIRKHLTYANVMATLAVFLVLGGGTALASYVISSNGQIGPGTVSGHKPPSGKHANIIAGSVSGTDLAPAAVGSAKLNVPATFTSAGLPDSTDGQCGSLNGWVNIKPSVYSRVGYYRGPDGLVHLQGYTQPCVPHNISIFSLPPGFRPAHRTLVVGNGSNGGGITIFDKAFDNGVFNWDAGAVSPGDFDDPISLDGITFRCGPSGAHGCP